MKNEQELIPYAASDLTGKCVLTLAPHPDDETIGCGGSLALHVQAGDPVKVVFLTNGAKGDSTGRIDKDEYVACRHMEAEEACKHLGITDVEFWAYEDRALASSKGKLSRLIELLNDFKPELVYVPSPLEFHPDHRGTAFLLEDAVRNCEPSFDIAFYEANQPLRVNVLVDITPVLQTKLDAIECYQSQLREMPYGEICLSLNKFRSLTLAKEITHAEGFSLWKSTLIRKVGFLSALSEDYGRLYPTIAESGPLVSLIIRTRNRPDLLANAVKSVCRQTYANIELIVINDGGEDIEDVVRGLCKDIPITYVAHESKRGRSAAANTGLRAAKGDYINFLDDDDIFYPHHVEKLITWISLKRVSVAYSSVLSVYFDRPPYLTEQCKRDELIYNIGFDPDRILFQNYIPLMSVMFKKKNLDKIGLFDEDLSVFEDWDLWIRMSRHFTFSHVDEVTAEYRFYGSESIVESHRQKYEYDKNQAKMFDRIIPYLNGEIWIKFLQSPYINSLRKIDNENKRTPQPFESFLKNADAVNLHLEAFSKIQLDTQDRTLELLARFDELLKTNHVALSNLKSFFDYNFEQRRTLQEIYASRSWKCLQLYRKIRHHSARILKNARFKKNAGNIGNTAPSPEVSIVIPAYNGGRYIEECLNSAINQSFSNIEIIITDDCSEDDTFLKVRNFMREDRRIAYFKNDVNLGLAMNWNKCLENCRGRWIKFLFQDDLLHPDCVETMLKSSFEDVNGNFPRLIIGERNFVIEEGISDVLKNYYEHQLLKIKDITENTTITPEDFSVAIIKAGIGINFVGEPSSVMLRRDIFSDYSLFNVNLVQLCDLEYWTRIGNNETIRYIPETLVSFRVHKGAASTFNHLHRAFHVDFLDKIILLHDYLFHPLYERFRAMIGSEQQLENELNETLVQSLNHIQNSNNTRDRNCFFEILSKYPSLNFHMPKPKV